MLPRMIAVIVALSDLAAATPARAVLISGVETPISDPALAGETANTVDATTAGAYGSQAIGNATFIGVDAPFNIGADFNGNSNTSGGQSLFNGTDFMPAPIRVDFATPVDAFAFNWGAADNQSLPSAFDSPNKLIEASSIPVVFSSNAGDHFGGAAAENRPILPIRGSWVSGNAGPEDGGRCWD